MKKHVYFLALLFICYVSNFLLSEAGYCQDTVTINDPPGPESQLYPFNTEDQYSRSISIYKNSELDLTGTIFRIAYNLMTTNDLEQVHIRIFMRSINLQVFQWPVIWEEMVAGADTIMDRKIIFSQTGWFTFNIKGDSVFKYDNTNKDLLILCEQWESKIQPPSVTPQFGYSNQLSDLHAYKGNSNPLQGDTLWTNIKRPDIQLTYISDPEYFVIDSVSSKAILLNWNLNNSGNGVVLVRKDADTIFTDPPQGQTNLPLKDSTFCGGKVIHVGIGTSTLDIGLIPNKEYYYKIFSYYNDPPNIPYFYSPGIYNSGKTTCFDTTNEIEIYGVTTFSICEGENPGTISGTQMDEGVSYRWYKSTHDTNNFILILDSIGQDFTPGILFDTTYYKREAYRETCSNFSNILSILVDPLSVAGEISGNSIVCQNQPNTFILTGSQGNNIHWEKSQDLIDWVTIPNSADTLLQHSFSTTDTNYLRAVVQSGVCIPETSEPFTVFVNPQPTAIITPPLSSICVFDSLMLSIEPDDPMTTIKWSRDHQLDITGIPPDGTSSPISGVIEAAITDAVIMTFEIILQNSESSCTDTIIKLITIKPTPPPNSIQGESDVCWGSKKTYSLEDQDTDVNYQWSISNTDIGEISGSSTIESVIVDWFETNAQVSTELIIERAFKGYGGCISKDQMTITVNPFEAPSDSLVRKKTADTSVLFLMCNKYINDSAVGLTFDWGYVNDGTIVPNVEFKDQYFCVFKVVDSTYQYYVDIGYSNSVSSAKCTTTTYYTFPSSGPNIKETINIYPNPNNGSFTLELSSDYIGESTIELFDIMGSLVHRLNVFKDQHRLSIPLNLRGLNAGIYIIKTQWGDDRESIRKVSVY